MRFCKKCVIPETAEGMVFDDDGVCQICKNALQKNTEIDWTERRKVLDSLLDKYRGKGDYDCIIPFSGGKDSTYQLLFAIKELKLRPLVVRYNHWGFRPQVEKNNIRTFEQLGCDVLQFTANWHVVRELMRKGIELRGDFCWHCHTGVYGYIMQTALRFGIKIILWGESPGEYSGLVSAKDIVELEKSYFSKFISLGLTAEEILSNHGITSITEREIRPFLFPDPDTIKKNDIHAIYLGNYINWSSKKHAAIIKDVLGWKGTEVEGIPPSWDYEKIECKWQGIRDWSKYIKRGFGRTAHLVSIDIRNGTMSREYGMELVRKYDGKRPASMDLFLERIGISEKQFMAWMLKHQVAPWKFSMEGIERGRPLEEMKLWNND